MHKRIIVRSLWTLLLLTALVSAQPRHLYLTWQGDTSTTMTVIFQTMTPAKNPTVYYGKNSARGLSEYESVEKGRPTKFPGLERWVHFVKLTGLEPGQTYYFRAGDESVGFP